MAESGSGQEKTEEPTGRKIQKSREDGQVARSRELNTFVMLIGSGFGFLFLGGALITGLVDILEDSFIIDRSQIFDSSLLPELFMEKITSAIDYVLPFFLLW